MSEEKHRCEYCEDMDTKPYIFFNCANSDEWTVWLCKEHAKKMTVF